MVTAATHSVVAYVAAAKQAADFVEDDAFNATMFMTDAELKFGVAEQAVAAQLGAVSKQAGAVERDAADMLRNAVVIMGVAGVVAVLLSVVSSTFFGRVISRPIVAMTAAMRQLAAGDLAVEIPAAGRDDEVGQMAQALSIFRANTEDARRLHQEADKANRSEEHTS